MPAASPARAGGVNGDDRLSVLPPDILQRVLQRLQFSERLALRQCCAALRAALPPTAVVVRAPSPSPASLCALRRHLYA